MEATRCCCCEASATKSLFYNYSNSLSEALRRVKQLANADFEICEGDIQNSGKLSEAIGSFRPEAVIHFAGLNAVGGSNEKPLEYYAQNVSSSIELLKAMQRHDCRRIVFSSSAIVHGEAKYLPYYEHHPLQPTNPYDRKKYFIEEIICDWAASWKNASAVLPWYFNPVGADASGRIGEDPNDIPNNLVPYISQVAVERLKQLNVFGADYEARDGTGERDYIHVEDLSRAHLAAIEFSAASTGCEAINVGMGHGATVIEIVKAFEHASGRPVTYEIGPRREGDVARSLAAVDKAERLLGWKAKLDVADHLELAIHQSQRLYTRIIEKTDYETCSQSCVSRCRFRHPFLAGHQGDAEGAATERG